MKILLATFMFSLILLAACESTDDILDRIDHKVPAIEFTNDTLAADPGSSITVSAIIEDESGIERIEFSYGSWRINQIVDLSQEPVTSSYSFTTEITIPTNAIKEWQEDKYFNDASSIKITQRYHPLALSAWDKNRNLNKVYVYVRVD